MPGGVDCGTTCSASFRLGSSVRLTATPGSNSTFTGWSGACGGTAACTITVSGARGVTAGFTPSKPTADGLGQPKLGTKTLQISSRVLFVHGFQPDSGANCNLWSEMIADFDRNDDRYDYTGALLETVGYYSDDTNCDVSIGNYGKNTIGWTVTPGLATPTRPASATLPNTLRG